MIGSFPRSRHFLTRKRRAGDEAADAGEAGEAAKRVCAEGVGALRQPLEPLSLAPHARAHAADNASCGAADADAENAPAAAAPGKGESAAAASSAVSATPQEAQALRSFVRAPAPPPSAPVRATRAKEPPLPRCAVELDASQPPHSLQHWGLPPSVVAAFATHRKITRLYDWQVECLSLPGVADGASLIYSAPTSGGKTLVAEVLMLRQVLRQRRKALFVVPYVSIVAEKSRALKQMFAPRDAAERRRTPLAERLRVAEFFGNRGGALTGNLDIAVCTIEKANSLLNRLLEERGSLDELACVVVDEIHLMGDEQRGYLLELLLAKIVSCELRGQQTQSAHHVQVIGMSATLANMDELCRAWRCARFASAFRPVPLAEFVKSGNTLVDREGRVVRTLAEPPPAAQAERLRDKDRVVFLCAEVVAAGHSALVFCLSKERCEALALTVAEVMPSLLARLAPTQQPPTSFAWQSDAQRARLARAVAELAQVPAGLDATLARTVPCGVAFHHAGLTFEEREVLEAAVRDGALQVVCCTSTLAAGVNLPCRRVIVRELRARKGAPPIDAAQYKQMSGRAGRAGQGVDGESIICLAQGDAVAEALALIHAPLPRIESRLCQGEDARPLRRLLLEGVACGLVRSRADAGAFVGCTLFAAQNDAQRVREATNEALAFLAANKFVRMDAARGDAVQPNQLGIAAVASSLPPEDAVVVFSDLRRAQEELVLADPLHVYYLLAPVRAAGLAPNWRSFYQLVLTLPPAQRRIAEAVGVDVRVLQRAALGQPASELAAHQYTRLWTALMLADLAADTPLAAVAARFSVSRGAVQALQSSAGSYSAMVALFCARLQWWDLELLATQGHAALSFDAKPEWAPLLPVAAGSSVAARLLFEAGLRTPAEVAALSEPVLARILRNARPFSLRSLPTAVSLGFQARRGAGSVFAAAGSGGGGGGVPWLTSEAAAAEVEASCRRGARRLLRAAAAVTKGQSSDAAQPLQQPPAQLAGSESVTLRAGAVNGVAIEDVTVSLERFYAFAEEWAAARSFALSLWLAPRAAVEGEARAVTLQPGHIRGRFTLSDVGGFAVSWATSKSFVLPLRHAREGDEPSEVAPRVVWDAVCEASEDAARTVIVGDAQRRLQLLRALGAAPRCLWSDPLVAHWLLQPEEKRALTVADLFAHYVARGDREGGGQVAAGRALAAAGTAVAAIAHQVPASLEAAARESSQTWAVATKLRQMLTTEGLQRVFDELEAPLVPVLAEMEWHGFAFDAAASARHRFDLAARLALLEHVAHRNAPSRFNLQSPDECGRVLFAELKLPPPPLARVFGVARAPQPQPQQLQQQQGDEGESRRFSSSRRVLQALARSHPHPVVSAIAEHRSLAHFFAQHMVGLPQCAVRDAAQSKERSADAALSSSALRPPPPPSPPPPPQSPPLSVHSALLQCEAATGRVVSVDPSLQTLSRGVVLPLAPLLSVHQELADAAATAAVEAAMREPPDSLLRAAVALTPARDCVRGQLVAVLRERSLTQPAAEGANGESLAEFWGARGFAYSEADAMKVCQVVLATDLGCSQTLPADKVWRLETACSCAASPPRPPLLTLRPPRETVRLSGRAALVARGGFRLLSADYAQMELRVLAHLSGDAELCSLFEAGTDAVSALAAELLAVPPAAVTRQLRTRAKQLLYGVVYGMGAQALAHELAVSPAEAAALIERATQRFPDALAFQRLTLERFRCQGYVETLGGRRRLLPQLRSRVPSERARAERQAFSTLVQGSAADVMKRALVLLRQRLEEAGLAARLLLVVHDEVLLEARVGELERTRAVLQHALEHAWPMRVPLRVRVREGASWAALAEAEAEVEAAGAIGAEDDGSQSESESPSEGEGEGKAP